MSSPGSPLKLKVQILCGDEIAIGPGKADLLEAIAATGSISAAGRHLGFSYRRTWLLADAMNRCWREPLIRTTHGGSQGGGASLTELGEQVLARFRSIEAAIEDAASAPFASLAGELLQQPRAARNA